MTAPVDPMTAILNRLRIALGPTAPVVENGSRPLYAKVLRLHHLEPGKLACAVFFEGSLVLAMLLAFTDLVSWYGVLTLPVTVAAMVKLNDLVAGRLPNPHAPRRPSRLGVVPTLAGGNGGRVPTFDGASSTDSEPLAGEDTAVLGFVPVKPAPFGEATTQFQKLPKIDGSP